jgi:ketosteroid isomerase-like protein
MTRPNEIRDSIACGDFAKAQRQFEDYAGEVRDAIEGGTCTADVVRQTDELIQWSREMVLSARAHLQDQLQNVRTRVYVAGLYSAP